MYKTKAIRFVQNGRIFYTTAIPAGKLADISQVDVWNPNKPNKGYQRDLSSARLRTIAKYAVRPDAIMPLGGLINARAGDGKSEAYGTILKFKPEVENGDISFGELSIPDETLLYIVDMQHRIGGFEWAFTEGGAQKLRDFPLPVTISDGLGLLEEVDQFELINTTQRKVRTDLARRLKAIQAKDPSRRVAMDEKGKLWEAKGPVIADVLNKGTGVWQGRIQPPNTSKSQMPAAVVRETSFVTSLKPVLQLPYFSRLSEKQAAELIGYFWEAISKVFPDDFKSPDQSVIQKTPGVFSLHVIAPEVFEMARDKGEITVKVIYDIVKSLASLGKDFWNNDPDVAGEAAQYGSMKGFKILAATLRDCLPIVH